MKTTKSNLAEEISLTGLMEEETCTTSSVNDCYDYLNTRLLLRRMNVYTDDSNNAYIENTYYGNKLLMRKMVASIDPVGQFKVAKYRLSENIQLPISDPEDVKCMSFVDALYKLAYDILANNAKNFINGTVIKMPSMNVFGNESGDNDIKKYYSYKMNNDEYIFITDKMINDAGELTITIPTDLTDKKHSRIELYYAFNDGTVFTVSLERNNKERQGMLFLHILTEDHDIMITTSYCCISTGSFDNILTWCSDKDKESGDLNRIYHIEFTRHMGRITEEFKTDDTTTKQEGSIYDSKYYTTENYIRDFCGIPVKTGHCWHCSIK